MFKVNVFDIERGSYVDGPGIRTTVFFKGCNLHCAWCHNPESQSVEKQKMRFPSKCTGCGTCKTICPSAEGCTLCGKCEAYCPNDAIRICGKEMTPDEILDEIQKDVNYYDNTGGGVTFSGGECMLQIDALTELLRLCKEHGIHTAVDTAGHVPYDYFERILPFTDLFLLDLKCMDPERHRIFTGVTNDRILSNLKALLKTQAHIWIRIPVVVGVNDTEEEMESVRQFFSFYGAPEKIELLPYHKMGEHKYAALGRSLKAFEIPTKERIDELYKTVRSR